MGVTNPSVWGSVQKDVATAASLIKSNTPFLLDVAPVAVDTKGDLTHRESSTTGLTKGSNRAVEAERLLNSELIPALSRLSQAVKEKNAAATLEVTAVVCNSLYLVYKFTLTML